MFNLLPKDIRDQVKKEYFLRELIVISLFVSFILTTFLIFNIPTWLNSYYKEKEVLINIDKVNESIDISLVGTNELIKLLNGRLKVIDGFLSYPKFVPFVKDILSKKTSSISLKEITFSSSTTTKANITIGGVAKTRESLLSFVKNLQDLKRFSKVDLPISNFTKDKDLNFSINIITE
jgi:hypothetical protein